ncbi:hypothetical protein NGRA_1674 [Nosema granulosis]|uniref:Uncharacterized protein n=1 Tax=Nosema granulosis TaxID=83296 RepID=A0A9P6GY39_9MICR|nr:hypothetical protein NGRA_1674 [Nosema granulosis]
MFFFIVLLVNVIFSAYIDDKIFSYKLDNYTSNTELINLKEEPEKWNIEIYSIDIYTFFITKRPVPFIVKPRENDTLEVFIYIGNVERYMASNILFYTVAYPIKNPTHTYRTSIYTLKRLVIDENYLTKIEYHVIVFLCHMVYLFKGIVEINIEDFPVSNYIQICENFSYSTYNISKRFTEEMPIKKYHTDNGFMKFIKEVLNFYSTYNIQAEDKNKLKDLIEEITKNNELNVLVINDKRYEIILDNINTIFQALLFEYNPVHRKLLEITGSRILKLVNSPNPCCYL